MPDSLGIPEETTANTIVVPYNDTKRFEDTIKKNRDDLAAVIVEPVVGNIGVVLPRRGFLETLRELTEKHGVVLIFDEVITGFRLSLGGAQQYFGITPDMSTLGKILGGGFPLAAFAGKGDIMRMIAPAGRIYQAGTFSGNPASVTAGLATLRLLREGGAEFYAKLESKCETIVKSLKEVISDFKLNMQINHIASMFQLFFTGETVKDYASAKTASNAAYLGFHKSLLKQGIFFPPSQFETCFLSVAHSTGDLDRTNACIKIALQ
jgi:glutamate-1-semialdehyde 2,1-aminomutase